MILAVFTTSFAIIAGCEKTPSGNHPGGDPSDNQSNDVIIFEDSSSLYKIVRPGEVNVAVIEFAKRFRVRLNKTGNCSIGLTSDSADTTSCEILIGETNRKESEKLYDDIGGLGRDGYIVRASGKKLLIGGTDEYMIYCGLGYVLSQVKDSCGKLSLVFPKGFEHVSGDEVNTVTPEEVISSGKEFDMYPVEKVKTMAKMDSFTVLQGGGTDGKYAYEAFINKTTLKAVIIKIDIATWETVKRSEPLNTGHTNDITYNPKLGLLVVNNSNDSWCGVSFIDPETLTETEYRVNTISARGISYIEETDKYVLGGVYDYYITDSNFNLQKQFTDGDPEYTTQGLFCDGTYIYDVRYYSDDGSDYVTVNNINGTYCGTATIPEITGEAESIFRIGNAFYVSYNKTNAIYKALLLPADWDF
ncbi:MAG: hypothetical protein LKK08_08690 [Bacteroidales bacterium]|nr:hypothetical protein [Bacteroidales bacterium]MCI2146296.1 hypothetical protein [Bacteroidales bacterium]